MFSSVQRGVTLLNMIPTSPTGSSSNVPDEASQFKSVSRSVSNDPHVNPLLAPHSALAQYRPALISRDSSQRLSLGDNASLSVPGPSTNNPESPETNMSNIFNETFQPLESGLSDVINSSLRLFDLDQMTQSNPNPSIDIYTTNLESDSVSIPVDEETPQRIADSMSHRPRPINSRDPSSGNDRLGSEVAIDVDPPVNMDVPSHSMRLRDHEDASGMNIPHLSIHEHDDDDPNVTSVFDFSIDSD